MTLTLTEEEGAELRNALELHLYRLQAELVKTDEREYRATLIATVARLEGIRAQLERTTAEAEVYG